MGYCVCGEGGAFFDVPFDAVGGFVSCGFWLRRRGGCLVVERGLNVRAAELGEDLVEEGDTGDDTLCIMLVYITL